MKFVECDELTWELFLQACNEVDDRCKGKHPIEDDVPLPIFNSIEEAVKYYCDRGGITIEEFMDKIKNEYGY